MKRDRQYPSLQKLLSIEKIFLCSHFTIHVVSFLLLCAYLLAQVSLEKRTISLVFVIIQSNFIVDPKPPMNKIQIEGKKQKTQRKQANMFEEFVSFLLLFQHACHKS